MLEHFDRHMKGCGYEYKTCKFSKCQASVLKMNIEEHESRLCEHREALCDGECGLMVALSDKPNHNCVTALKENIEGTYSNRLCLAYNALTTFMYNHKTRNAL